MRAAAIAASTPACPAPTMTTSYFSLKPETMSWIPARKARPYSTKRRRLSASDRNTGPKAGGHADSGCAFVLNSPQEGGNEYGLNSQRAAGAAAFLLVAVGGDLLFARRNILGHCAQADLHSSADRVHRFWIGVDGDHAAQDRHGAYRPQRHRAERPSRPTERRAD